MGRARPNPQRESGKSFHQDPTILARKATTVDCTGRVAVHCSRHNERQNEVPHQISDIIINPPNSDLYSTLKKRIITQFADSEQNRVKKLLQEQELGDMRPSKLLREMRSLPGSEDNDNILKSIFMSQLPSNMRLIISISNELLDKVALLADKICEVSDTLHVHAVETLNTATRNQSDIQQQLAEISKEIASI
ncbi:PREDICTED: uncharacterized protein LOC108977292 [Bactrocera latifrons]|uniref:uncharacterized protein LOC108977292 n=1 Tax=Bactrocera latifrons TaxID=174628 RepID=UPI0008DD4081|nr:PREDICTED: uncharacterized protein LOC108977292 [Bactrocera latifrons]